MKSEIENSTYLKKGIAVINTASYTKGITNWKKKKQDSKDTSSVKI